MMKAPMFWPTRDAKHAGILDIGLIGGAIYDPDHNSWKFARESEGFYYTSSSPLTQMLSRERPWDPLPHSRWGQLKQPRYMPKFNTEITQSMNFLTTRNPLDWLNDLSVQENLAESMYEDAVLSYYDPYQGNLCSVGNFAGLPVVVTPSGLTGSDLSVDLVNHKPYQQPPFTLIRPKSSLLSFLSPILQTALPSLESKNKMDEQILIRTRESITIVTPQNSIPLQLSRIMPEHICIAGSIASKPANCRDNTIHATISPYIPNTYALVGEEGRIAIWTRGNTGQNLRSTTSAHYSQDTPDNNVMLIRKRDGASDNQDDPWRSCIWTAHPSNLIVTSRTNMELIDYRGPTATVSLFQLRNGESIQALQENNVSAINPFYTYVATSHQIACVDQRFPKRPLISTAHQMGRTMPCGLKAMDIVTEDSQYTTVLTWDMRNAGITAYNFLHGSSEGLEAEISAMSGGAQELPSFHTHAQYTNTSELRNPLKRSDFKAAFGDRMYHAVKPPLMGLAVLPTSALIVDNENNDDPSNQRPTVTLLGTDSDIKFSVIQYAATGAVYAQEIDMIKKQDGMDVSLMDQILKSGNKLAIDIAQNTMEIEGDKGHSEVGEEQQLQIVKEIFDTSESYVAPWKKGVKEAQIEADKPVVTELEVREHIKIDVSQLMEGLREYLLLDREVDQDSIDLEVKVNEAIEFIKRSAPSVTMYEVLHAIRCSHLPIATREAVSQEIQNQVTLSSLIITTQKYIIKHNVIRAWPSLDHDISATIRHSPEATVETIQNYLEQLYPHPKPHVLGPTSKSQSTWNHRNDKGKQNTKCSCSKDNLESELNGTNVWPSQESRQIRASTIRRMAQELALATTVIVKNMEPIEQVTREDIVGSSDDVTTAAMTAVKTERQLKFKYLFQETKNDSFVPPDVRLSVRAQGVLDEWYSGDITKDFVYANNDGDMEDDIDTGIVTEEVKLAQAEALKRRRAKLEKKENKLRGARMQDPSYNISAKGSYSQPTTGIVAEDDQLFTSTMVADEDGMFSAPMIQSASQLRRNIITKSRSQQLVRMSNTSASSAADTTITSNLFSFSQPTVIGSSKGGFSSNSQPNLKEEWMETSPTGYLSHPTRQVPGAVKETFNTFSASQNLSQEIAASQSQTQDVLFAASQPVPGTFANKRIKGTTIDPNSKPKKKKIRTQGF
ncbi:TATA box-binding protein-associated factor RNA polymerase I subunit C [Linnemannia zychae]|nr:TATA box-binding protein-associated factor RNA polymerase I subunit C [Linnemannia zychae]